MQDSPAKKSKLSLGDLGVAQILAMVFGTAKTMGARAQSFLSMGGYTPTGKPQQRNRSKKERMARRASRKSRSINRA